MAVVGVVEVAPAAGAVVATVEVTAGTVDPGDDVGEEVGVGCAAVDGGTVVPRVVVGGVVEVVGLAAAVVVVVAPGPVAVVVSLLRRTSTVTMATASRIRISGSNSRGDWRRLDLPAWSWDATAGA